MKAGKTLKLNQKQKQNTKHKTPLRKKLNIKLKSKLSIIHSNVLLNQYKLIHDESSICRHHFMLHVCRIRLYPQITMP
jgi:hypothetical protein